MAYQSTHTGAQVDEAVDKALSADAVPTPSSTNLVQSGGVYGVLSNRNLLDNAFFTINQRGSASYTTAGYTVDRWKLNVLGTTAQSVTVNTNGITLSGTASGSNSCLLRQTLENGSQYAGKTVTLSVLVGTVVGNRVRAYIGTNANERFAACSLLGNGVYTKTVTLPNDITSLFIQIGTHASDAGTGNISAEIRAVKLELGSVSTLANDTPPNYGEEFEQCATSRADSTDTYANQAPASMRGFVPLLYTGTLPENGGTVNQEMFSGYNEYYLVDLQYLNLNNSTYVLSASAFTNSPFIQYTKNNPTIACRIRFTINSESDWNGRPYYVLVMAR